MTKTEPKNVDLKPGEKVITETAKPAHMRRWGMKEHPSNEFIRVTFLVTGSISGERFMQGKSGDVPKGVFESTLKPQKMAKLWEKPKPKPVAVRPGTDVGAFRRR